VSVKPAVLYLSHGGGPLPLLGDPGHREMVACLRDLAVRLDKPSAILVVSAHWEEQFPTVTAGAAPPLIYDYYGFPEAAYRIEYPCPGEPRLAADIGAALQEAGLPGRLDPQRGFDHGLFVPLKIMYPDADIPCVQLSLLGSLDAAMHVKLGESLRALAGDNLLVIGSGFTFHNMQAFRDADVSAFQRMNRAFEDWLQDTCCDRALDESTRAARLIDWTSAPHARYCHPREEHLLPLHVCYGLAGGPCSEYFEVEILKTRSSMFLWQPE